MDKSLQKLSLTDLTGRTEVSPEAFAKGVAKLKLNFPRIKPPWFKLLEEYLDKEGFSDIMFTDAVDNCIKTCKYEPTIAHIIGYKTETEVKVYGTRA